MEQASPRGSSEAVQRQNSPQYWCHTCRSEVAARVVPETHEIECSVCKNSFVEEVEGSENHPSTYPTINSQSAREGPAARLAGLRADAPGANGISRFVQQLFQDLNNNQGGGPGRDPMAFFIQHGGPGMMGFGPELAGNPGDYHFGTGAALDALLNQLMQADNARGAPPASKAAVKALPLVKVTKEHVESQSDCAVCKDLLELGKECIQLPCMHLFCQECIRPWLKEHNTCPVCRHELPTDDADYERERKSRRRNADSSAAPGSAGSGRA